MRRDARWQGVHRSDRKSARPSCLLALGLAGSLDHIEDNEQWNAQSCSPFNRVSECLGEQFFMSNRASQLSAEHPRLQAGSCPFRQSSAHEERHTLETIAVGSFGALLSCVAEARGAGLRLSRADQLPGGGSLPDRLLACHPWSRCSRQQQSPS